ncbi:MAG: 30S ribosomal protein S15 [Elusimicrobia bacterium]|nr:30S ribosomal protein S15 [Elusimicrobiota bacterium]
MITREKKLEIVAKHQKHAKDTGHPGVQVALLTERIRLASGHLKSHRKDYTSQVGLLKMVGARKRLLTYLKRTEPQEYEKLIKQLELRK